VGRAIPGTDGLAVSLAVAAVLTAPLGIGRASAALGDPTVLLVFVAVAVLSSTLPYALEMEALRRLPTRVFGVISSLGPAAAAIAGLIVLRQAMGFTEITALLLVSIASVGITLAHRRGRSAGPVLDVH
jgi:inner membrane transporter RhtA